MPADTIVVYIAGAPSGNSDEAGFGGPGGYNASGNAAFLNSVQNRGQSGFGPWGGSISFSTNQPFYYGTATPVPQGNVDFLSTATHESNHVLGIGTSNQWDSLVSSQFANSHARAVTPTVSTSPDGQHFAQNTLSYGQTVLMQPKFLTGTRVPESELDYAALQDIGWSVRSAVPPVTPRKTVQSDFNGDGVSDILWHNPQTGGNVVWYMQAPVPASHAGTIKDYATYGNSATTDTPVT